MKLILITLVALVVGLMVACSSEPATPMNTPPPAFSDEEVIGAVKGFLTGAGKHEQCTSLSGRLSYSYTLNVNQYPSNRDKYYITVDKMPEWSWTFIGSSGLVISTVKTPSLAGYGC